MEQVKSVYESKRDTPFVSFPMILLFSISTISLPFSYNTVTTTLPRDGVRLVFLLQPGLQYPTKHLQLPALDISGFVI